MPCGNDVGPHFCETHSEQHSAKALTRFKDTDLEDAFGEAKAGRQIVAVRMRRSAKNVDRVTLRTNRFGWGTSPVVAKY